MFKRALRYIRQKPKMVRNQYALAISSVFTAIVVMIWLATGVSDIGARNSTTKEGSAPFSNLIKQAKDQFATVKASLPKTEDKTVASSTDDSNTSSSPQEMILSPETLAGYNQSSTTVNPSASNQVEIQTADDGQISTASTTQYVEVQIVTTSPSTTSSTAPQQ